MLVLSMWEDNLVPGSTYKTYALMRADIERLSRLLSPSDHVSRSYTAGSSPANGYVVNENEDVLVRFRPQEKAVGSIESGIYKVFVWSTGADSARPLTLKRNSKVYEYIALLELDTNELMIYYCIYAGILESI